MKARNLSCCWRRSVPRVRATSAHWRSTSSDCADNEPDWNVRGFCMWRRPARAASYTGLARRRLIARANWRRAPTQRWDCCGLPSVPRFALPLCLRPNLQQHPSTTRNGGCAPTGCRRICQNRWSPCVLTFRSAKPAPSPNTCGWGWRLVPSARLCTPNCSAWRSCMCSLARLMSRRQSMPDGWRNWVWWPRKERWRQNELSRRWRRPCRICGVVGCWIGIIASPTANGA